MTKGLCSRLDEVGSSRHQTSAFVEDYNHRRYHESLDNATQPTLTSAPAIIKQGERIKRQTDQHRRLQHRKKTA